jgi:hypothetical protein
MGSTFSKPQELSQPSECSQPCPATGADFSSFVRSKSTQSAEDSPEPKDERSFLSDGLGDQTREQLQVHAEQFQPESSLENTR